MAVAVASAWVSFFTPVYRLHPAPTLVAMGLMIVVTAARIVISLRFEKDYAANPGRWLASFQVCVLLMGAIWAAFSAFVVITFGFCTRLGAALRRQRRHDGRARSPRSPRACAWSRST